MSKPSGTTEASPKTSVAEATARESLIFTFGRGLGAGG